jgi:hypothetical protein
MLRDEALGAFRYAWGDRIGTLSLPPTGTWTSFCGVEECLGYPHDDHPVVTRSGRPIPRRAGAEPIWDSCCATTICIERWGQQLTIVVVYEVDWDIEHTPGAIIQNGQLVERCGNVP